MKFHELGEGVVMLAICVVKLEKRFHGHLCFVFLSLKKNKRSFFKVGF